MKIKILLSCTILCFTPVFLHAFHVSDPQTHALINASNAAQSANCALEEATKLIQHLERAANQVTQIGHMIDTFNNLEIQREFFNKQIGEVESITQYLDMDFTDIGVYESLLEQASRYVAQPSASYDESSVGNADQIIGDSMLRDIAENQKALSGQAEGTIAMMETSDKQSKDQLRKLMQADEKFQRQVSSGNADIVNYLQAIDQGLLYMAQEMTRMNANIAQQNKLLGQQIQQEEDMDLAATEEIAKNVIETKKVNEEANSNVQKNAQKHNGNAFVNDSLDAITEYLLW